MPPTLIKISQRINYAFPLAWFSFLLVMSLPVFATAQPASPPGMVLRNGQLIQFNDPFDSMVASAASFDIDSPVEITAAFEPATIPADGHALYRIVITALDESTAVPEKLPFPPGLEVRPGGRGQTYRSSGGMKIRPQTTLLYHVTATNTGTFTIPAFDIAAYEKPIKVPAATLAVVSAGSILVPAPPRLSVDLPHGNSFVGQLVKISLILPADGRMMGLNQPRVKGEFIFSEQSAVSLSQQMIERDGKSIPAFVQQVSITPLREGEEHLIGQAHAISLRPNPAQPNVLMPAAELIDSDPIILTVKALPKTGVLPGFNGAVGNFQIERPEISSREVKAGEPIVMTINIRGEGNLGRLTGPPIPSVHEWQIFAAPTDPNTASAIQQNGFASFQYSLIPLDAGIENTPAFPFSYFDPVKQTYIDLTIPPVPVKVIASPIAATAPPPTAPATPNLDAENNSKEEVTPGFAGLMTALGWLAGDRQPTQQRVGFLFLQLLPAVALGGLWYWDHRRRYLLAHPSIVLKCRARKNLRRQLAYTRRAARSGNAAGFIAGATSALREACAPYRAANPDALVCADVLEALPENVRRGAAEETVRQLFAASHALRFGGKPGENAELFALQPELETLLAGLKVSLQ